MIDKNLLLRIYIIHREIIIYFAMFCIHCSRIIGWCIELFQGELLLYLTNCSIFKSSDSQFKDPYTKDSGEDNPCHELWCKTLELITYLLRQTALALNTRPATLEQDKVDLMSKFIRNIMQFCNVHHNRIYAKIQYWPIRIQI